MCKMTQKASRGQDIIVKARDLIEFFLISYLELLRFLTNDYPISFSALILAPLFQIVTWVQLLKLGPQTGSWFSSNFGVNFMPKFDSRNSNSTDHDKCGGYGITNI